MGAVATGDARRANAISSLEDFAVNDDTNDRS